jgi:hypothetical protein
MGEMLDIAFISGLIGATMRMATPIIFATLGEILAERSGVLNLGIEGIMLMGAMTGFLITFTSGSIWFGVLAAAVVGMLLGLLMAFLAVNLGLSQHVSGLGITLFATGLAMFIYRLHFGSPTVPPIIKPFKQIALPVLSKIPLIGPGLFTQYSLTYIAWLLIPVMSILLYKTNIGLKIRTDGYRRVLPHLGPSEHVPDRCDWRQRMGRYCHGYFRKLGSAQGHIRGSYFWFPGWSSAKTARYGDRNLLSCFPDDSISFDNRRPDRRLQKGCCSCKSAETLSQRGEGGINRSRLEGQTG